MLAVEGLTTEFATDDGVVRAVEDVSFELYPGETLGIVGESGSGKSVTARSIVGLLDDTGRIAAGSVRLNGTELTTLSERRLQRVRGTEIAMVFQDPTAALTPVVTVGTQLVETILTHQDVTKREARARAVDLLESVRIADPEAVVDAYPHQLSGGQRQRVLVAIAVSCDPDVLIADEPTTALDVTIEAQLLDLLDEVARERDLSVVHITHDLGVIAAAADRVAVMYAGRFVETGATDDVFGSPRHPYTAGLLRATPRLEDVEPELLAGSVPTPESRPRGCNFAPRCPHATDACLADDPPLSALDGHDLDERDLGADGLDGRDAGGRGARAVACVRTEAIGALDPTPPATRDRRAGANPGETLVEALGLRKEFSAASGLVDRLLPGGDPPVQAVDGVDLALREHETVALVGESGSGKTTLGRLLVALTDPTHGAVRFAGRDLTAVPDAELRGRVQFVFQDPSSSLNPRQTVGRILRYAVEKHDDSDGDAEARVVELLEEVGLDPATRDQYPHQLSGGQKQRVAVARALAVDPDVLIADEPTSALDVSVQGQVLHLLDRIQRERGLAMLFVSHDLSVVRHVSDRVAVMYLGRIVEVGATEALFETPLHPYTEALISAVSSPDRGDESERIVLDGEIPDPKAPPTGCNFASRCPKAMDECHGRDPDLVPVEDDGDLDGREVACLLHSDATRSEPSR